LSLDVERLVLISLGNRSLIAVTGFAWLQNKPNSWKSIQISRVLKNRCVVVEGLTTRIHPISFASEFRNWVTKVVRFFYITRNIRIKDVNLSRPISKLVHPDSRIVTLQDQYLHRRLVVHGNYRVMKCKYFCMIENRRILRQMIHQFEEQPFVKWTKSEL
jgi:hypothetical protein